MGVQEPALSHCRFRSQTPLLPLPLLHMSSLTGDQALANAVKFLGTPQVRATRAP